jgi:hypothetical protein
MVLLPAPEGPSMATIRCFGESAAIRVSSAIGEMRSGEKPFERRIWERKYYYPKPRWERPIFRRAEGVQYPVFFRDLSGRT